MDQKTPKAAKATNPVTLGYVKQLDLSKQIKRAGIVVYSVIGDGLYFGLGIDSKHSELTDFGGSVDPLRDKDAIDTAIREFREESLGAFGVLTRSMISNCFAMHDSSTLIIFVHMLIEPVEVSTRFEAARRMVKSPEVDVLVWLSKEQLEEEIDKEQGSPIYDLVRRLMKRSGNFFDWL